MVILYGAIDVDEKLLYAMLLLYFYFTVNFFFTRCFYPTTQCSTRNFSLTGSSNVITFLSECFYRWFRAFWGSITRKDGHFLEGDPQNAWKSVSSWTPRRCATGVSLKTGESNGKNCQKYHLSPHDVPLYGVAPLLSTPTATTTDTTKIEKRTPYSTSFRTRVVSSTPAGNTILRKWKYDKRKSRNEIRY